MSETGAGRLDDRIARAIVWLVVCAGIGLLVRQYVAGASLWIDELALVRNITERDWSHLLGQPLDSYQVAPLGFLAIEKAVTSAFGSSNWAMRAVPLVAAAGALVMLAVVALRALPARAAIVAVSIMAFAGRLVWNGSQAKQYATDVLASVLVLWAVQRWHENHSSRRTLQAIALGVALAFVSQPAAFVLGAAAIAVVAVSFRLPNDVERRRAIGLAGTWVGAAAVAAFVARSRVSADTLDLMHGYWIDGFAPFPPHSVQDLLWPWHRLSVLFGATLSFRVGTVYALAAIGGAIVLLMQSPLGMAVVLPVPGAMAASALGLYPFIDRPAVFAIPLLALWCAAGVEAAGRLVAPHRPALRLALALAIVAGPVEAIVRRPPVYRVQDIEPLLRAVAKERRAGDALYIYYGAAPALKHYGPRVGLPLEGVVWGTCERGNTRAYLREIDALRGKPRAWIAFSHAEPGLYERQSMLAYLDSIGTQLLTLSAPDPYVPSVAAADVHLYDLSDSSRLQRADAEHFPVAPLRGDTKRECRGPFTIPESQSSVR